MARNQRDQILVVDDDRDAGDSLATALAEAGFEVDTARDGYEALMKLSGSSHDVVLADVQMPGLDGLALLRKVHELDPARPVILMTAFTTRDLVTGARAYGAVDCLVKPIDLEKLVWTIEMAILLHSAPPEPIHPLTGSS